MSDKDYYVVNLTRDQLGEIVHQWNDLIDHAIEPNVFYEPFFFLPAYDHLRGKDEDVSLFAVFCGDRNSSYKQSLFTGFFPLVTTRLGSRRVKVRRLWRHRHCYLGTPLVHKKFAVPALQALVHHLHEQRHAPTILEFDLISGAGNFFNAFNEAFLSKRRASILNSFTRPVWRPEKDAESYLFASNSKKHRQSVRRKWEELNRQAPLSFRVAKGPGDLSEELDAFLKLEGSSWKGEEGTALMCSEDDRSFIEEVVTRGADEGKVTFYSLYHGDAPLAYHLALNSGSTAYAFKIAFNEDHGSQSPGQLLENEISRVRHETRAVAWCDSCTDGQVGLIDRIWKDRFVIHHALIPLRGITPSLVLNAMPVWQGLRSLRRER